MYVAEQDSVFCHVLQWYTFIPLQRGLQSWAVSVIKKKKKNEAHDKLWDTTQGVNDCK